MKRVLEKKKNVYEFYVGAFEPGAWYTRREVSEQQGIPYTTVVYNLDRAVRAGALVRQKYLVNSQPTWVYGLPETMRQLAVTK